MVLGTTDHKLSFPVVDSLNLLGMTIDNQLNFSEHVSLVCKKVNNQLNVMFRFRNLICIATKLKFYNAFILPHFQYCSMVWHFCSARNCNNLLISTPYVLFLTEGYKISQLITIYKCLNYMKVLLNILKTCLLCISLYTLLRELNYNILSLCKPATTTYGLNSFRYFASKKWNSLPNKVRSEPTLSGFRRLLKAISFLT